MQKHKTL